MRRKNITAEEARSVLDYDPDTGALVWRERPNARANAAAGMTAGCIIKGRGYVSLNIKNVTYYAHRVIWLMMTGEHPRDFIDHVNGDRADNRWCNLRAATHPENMRNCSRRRPDRISEFKGVYPSKNRWRARIWVDGRNVGLGSFATAEEASAAYRCAAQKHHGAFFRA